MSAGEIAEHFTISRPAVSQHLKALLAAGVVSVAPQGTRRLYSLEPAALEPVTDWLEAQRQRWARSLDALEATLDKEHP